ncbi:hypothetical protein Cch01nite_44620 [Cellulomonas chitinilytica]|uniref:Pyrrolo-quinoline quinone repeat domain-containing protein n=1 Tax=Cellulomonas chitinilytica TaxID=398759 RepID=A0A919U1Z9_9CELL|nr:hypothetical protein Cch01nite_44620 [Cellulomonas chitinilytica]
MAGLAAGQWFVDARERAVVAALARVDGVVPPLGDTVETSPLSTQEVEEYQLADLDLPAATVTAGADGSRSVVSSHVGADGQPLWSVPVLAPASAGASSGDAGPSDVSRCVTGAGKDATAVCVVSDAVLTVSDSVPLLRPATTTKVVVVGTDDGQVLSTWATGPAVAVASLPGVVLTGYADESSRVVTVVAHDETTGAERWRYTMPLSEGSAAAAWGIGRAVYTVGDLAVVTDEMAMTVLDADGRVVRDDLGRGDGVAAYGYVLDGALVVSTMTRSGEATTTVLAPDGDPRSDRVYTGDLMTPVDDGSVPGLVLTITSGSLPLAQQMGDESTRPGRGPGLRAYDSATGEELWYARLSTNAGPTGAIVLRGRVYVTSTAAAVVALDARTGRRVWKSADTGTDLGMFTDGRWVYSVVHRPLSSDDAWLVGWDLRSGAERWSARLPDGLEAVTVEGHTLLAIDFTNGRSSHLS